MLIPKSFWAPIRSGEVTLVFRRWSRPQVLAGRVYRTAAGRLAVSRVSVVTPDEITGIEAARPATQTRRPSPPHCGAGQKTPSTASNSVISTNPTRGQCSPTTPTSGRRR